MAASAIAIPTFGSGRALLATDLTDGVHTLQVTTDAPDSAIAIWGFASTKYVIGTVEADGIHTLCVSTDSPDSGIAVWGWGAEKYVLGTVETSGVHVMCVSTDSPDNAIAMPGFGNGVVIFATVESGGVHVPVVSDAESGDAPFALWEWGNEKTVLAADTSGSGPAVIPLVLGLGPAYDPDAQAYIDATGALFPDALNTFVLGVKAAGLWDDHLGSMKFAIGVPSLAASLIDLRNTAFNGTAVNNPTHSATAGWTFDKASSQYIDSGWKVAAAGSKASQDSVHIGLRLMSAPVDGGANLSLSFTNPYGLGFGYLFNGFVDFSANDSSGPLSNNPATVVGAGWIGTRTANNARATYRAGVLNSSDTAASSGLTGHNSFISARNAAGTPANFATSRITAWHAGAGLDASQSAALDTLIATYAAACGET